MNNYVGKTNGKAAAAILPSQGRRLRVKSLHLYNPNATTVTGTLSLVDQGTTFTWLKFSVDGTSPWVYAPDFYLTETQQLIVTPDAAPTAELTLASCWD